MHLSLSKLQELVMDREAWGAAVHGATKSWTSLSGWTELKGVQSYCYVFPWRGNQDPTPSLHYCCSSLVSASPPCSWYLEFWEGNGGWSLFPTNKKQGHIQAFVPRSPIGSCSVHPCIQEYTEIWVLWYFLSSDYSFSISF